MEWTTSILKKCFNFSKVLISNSLIRHWLNLCYSSSSFSITIISSTYTNKIDTPPKLECLLNKIVVFLTLSILKAHYDFGEPPKPCSKWLFQPIQHLS